MKKLALILLALFILTLIACNASNAANPAAASRGDPSAAALPATTQLIIGTLKLEGTAQEVSTEQAADLLPLWQTMLVLTNSDTAADQEKEALMTQIQESMTAEQTQAITDLNLSRADMMSIMQEQGMAMGNGSQSSISQSGDSSSGRNFGPGAGGPPDEMPMPGGGGGFGPSGPGQNLTADEVATAPAARQGSENFVPPVLINAVIEYLQEKADP